MARALPWSKLASCPVSVTLVDVYQSCHTRTQKVLPARGRTSRALAAAGQARLSAGQTARCGSATFGPPTATRPLGSAGVRS
jgi:hypothetical protein